MSLASKAFRITAIVGSLSTLFVFALALAFLHQSITHQQEQALSDARQVIIQANGGTPDWYLIENQYAYSRLIITDLAANSQVVSYQNTQAKSALNQWLEAQLKPQLPKQVIHDYELILELDHSHQLTLFIELLTGTVIIILCCGFLAGGLSARAAKRQLERDLQELSDAIEQLANKEPGVSLGELVSLDFRSLDEPLAKLESKLLCELQEVKNHASSLEHQAFYDPLTGLANKSKFKQEMLPKLKVGPSTYFGVLAIVRGLNLRHINEHSGYNAGDEYIRQLAEALANTSAHFQQPHLYRLNSSDLAIVLDFASKKEYEKLGVQLENQFNDLAHQLNLEEVANIGITLFQSGDDVSELLCRCDNALNIAATRSGNSWHFSDTPIDGPLQGRIKWRAMITQIIEESKVELFSQPQMALNESTLVYSELQARFFNAENEQVSTASILAEAQSNDLIIRLDKAIVDKALTLIRPTASRGKLFAINLSNSSILDTHFCIWLERQLLRETAITRHLVFEISEHGLTADISAGHRIIDIIHRVGARVTIEHFGSSLLSLKYFRELSPDYVKLDASHSAHILTDKKLQYFIRTLVDITHQMGVKVIAEAVETVEQKQLLENLNIDVIQGYFVGKPAPLTPSPGESSASEPEPEL